MWELTLTDYNNLMTENALTKFLEKPELLNPSGSWYMKETARKWNRRWWERWMINHASKIEWHWNWCGGLPWPTIKIIWRRTCWWLFWTKPELLSPSGSWDMKEVVRKWNMRWRLRWMIHHVLKIEWNINKCEGLPWPTITVRWQITRWWTLWVKPELLSPSGSWDMKEVVNKWNRRWRSRLMIHHVSKIE